MNTNSFLLSGYVTNYDFHRMAPPFSAILEPSTRKYNNRNTRNPNFQIMSTYSLSYRNNKPPQLRTYPPIEPYINGLLLQYYPQTQNYQNVGANTAATSADSVIVREPLNLMNFDDLASSNVSSSYEENKPRASIDDLFTCQQEFDAEILKPNVLSWLPAAENTEWGPKTENEDSSSHFGMMSPKAGSSVSRNE